MSNNNKIRDDLFARTGKGIKYDLVRVREASELSGNAHKHFKSIHVAGTNGKGSTCVYLESMLRSQGYSTGLYTSPHLINFEERFVVNGKPVSENEWCEVYDDLQKIIDSFDLTFFEATTLIAFEIFKRNNVQWAVIETGLGGRLDATNIILPVVSVITAIDLDHKEYLGDTINLVAAEKFGIIKQHVPAVVAFNPTTSVMQLATDMCMQKGSPLTIVSEETCTYIDDGSYFNITDQDKQSYQIAMRGTFQIVNALVAVNALKAAGLPVDKKALFGLKNAHLPGRMQEITYNGKIVLLDVGHNCQAATVLVKELSKRYYNHTICIVTGIMSDKDYQAMLNCYSLIATRIILTKPEIPRAATTQRLQSCLGSGVNVSVFEHISEACTNALAGEELVICITGSFYTVGEACLALKINPFVIK